MLLRDYQKECHEIIDKKGQGKWLISMATGTGKTATFTALSRPENTQTLFLVHRQELVDQIESYFNCEVGVEMGARKAKGTEPIIIASVQSLMNRMDKYHPEQFYRVIADEVHHYSSKTYRKVLEFFIPYQRLGFTATPNRADGVRLDDLFDEIIFERDIIFGITNKYLCPVKCFKVDIDYNISEVAAKMGDFTISELDKQLNIEKANNCIKKIVEDHPSPALVFCVSVEHANEVAKVTGGVAITATTKNRKEILNDYRDGHVPVLTTVGVLTEGVDLPNVRTLIMARPTKSEVLYTQMAGRGLRLAPGKECCHIVDCVGNVGKHQLCGHHTLIGFDIDEVPPYSVVELEGDLISELPQLIKKKADCPESWIKNIKMVELFAKKNNYRMYNINYTKHPDGSFIVSLPDNKWVGIEKINKLGQTRMISSRTTTELKPAQEVFDLIAQLLNKHFKDSRPLWNTKSIKRWGKTDGSIAQQNYATGLLRQNGFDNFSIYGLSKSELSCIINRLNKPKRKIQHDESHRIKKNQETPGLRVKFGGSV